MSETFSFEAQTDRLLELLTHSIYSNKEIFLRELISNASDAIDKAKILSLTDTNYLEENTQFHIRVTADETAKTLTIEDNGVGMTKDELIEHLGTIAKSGTKEFLEKLKDSKQDHALIGQFGVGFYSAFMVANSVDVISRSAHSPQGHIWSSDGKNSFTLDVHPTEKRGTTLVLHLRDDAEEFLKDWKIRELIRKHSNYVAVPIEMEKTEGETKTWEQMNEMKPLWARPKSEITDEMHKEFYQSISFDFEAPLAHIHTESEGGVSYKALLYLPTKRSPFAQDDPSADYGPKLYTQNVMILEHAKELLPSWLRFVHGVVSTHDLPLNISREMLQANTSMEKIKKSLTKKVLDKLASIAQESPDAYKEFYTHYARNLKEGVYYETDVQEKILGLLQLEHSEGDGHITLDNYKEKSTLQEGKKLYYLLAKNRQEALSYPYLAPFVEQHIDVLLLTDPIDEWILSRVTKYQDWEFVSISTGEAPPSDKTPEETKQELEAQTEQFKDICTFFQNTAGKDILKTVQLSKNLGTHLAALKIENGATTPQMRKMMQAMGQTIPEDKRILEINPEHAIAQSMKALFEANPQDEELQKLMQYTLYQAKMLDGDEIHDKREFFNILEWFIARK